MDSSLVMGIGIEGRLYFTFHLGGSDLWDGGSPSLSPREVCVLPLDEMMLTDIPAGSVSVGVWQMACRRVIKVGERVVKDLVGKSPPVH